VVSALCLGVLPTDASVRRIVPVLEAFCSLLSDCDLTQKDCYRGEVEGLLGKPL